MKNSSSIQILFPSDNLIEKNQEIDKLNTITKTENHIIHNRVQNLSI